MEAFSDPSVKGIFSIIGGDISLLTGNCGKGRAASLKEYETAGGYKALRKALEQYK